MTNCQCPILRGYSAPLIYFEKEKGKKIQYRKRTKTHEEPVDEVGDIEVDEAEGGPAEGRELAETEVDVVVV